MALTKEDLQAISELMDVKLAPIKEDLSSLKADMAEVKADIVTLKADVSGLKADVSGLKADVSGLKADVSGLKADMAEVKDRLLNLELIQENQILPHIRLLAEGHASLVERLDRLDSLREKVEDIHVTTQAVKLAFMSHVRN